jgi:modulator of FtsH protease
MTLVDVTGWESFAVAMAGAAAVLAGLVFVAVSVNIDRIIAVRGLPGRAGDSIIMFMTAVVECAFVLVPRQTATALGVELLLTGVVASGVLLAVVIPGVRMPSRQPLSWRAFRLATTQIVTVPAILAGTSLLGWPPGGLYWLVAAVLAALLAATGNAWVLLVEVVRDKRYQPLTSALKPPDDEDRA